MLEGSSAQKNQKIYDANSLDCRLRREFKDATKSVKVVGFFRDADADGDHRNHSDAFSNSAGIYCALRLIGPAYEFD
ncbi:hypothetical protein BI292_04795 [Pseudomonas sp. 43NM1]|nr:hypothetical protein BI292_04795 [Pseudomonas sp. 43NM1]